MLNEGVNQSVCYRTRQCFYSYGRLSTARTAASTNESRWWFAFKTGPYHHALYAIAALWPDTDAPVTPRNASARLDIYSNTTMSALVTSVTFTYGSHPNNGAASGVDYSHIKEIKNYVTGLAANTTYYGVWSAVDKCRLLGATVFDLQSMTAANGYLPQNLGARSGIFSKYREDQATIMNALWSNAAAQVFNWTCETAPRTISVGTATNVLDGTTAVSPSSIGWTLDMTGKSRLTQSTGVPVTMYILASMAAAANGTVSLVNSSGVAVLTATITATTPTWVTATGVLPASQGKYDLVYSVAASTLNLYAVGVFES